MGLEWRIEERRAKGIRILQQGGLSNMEARSEGNVGKTLQQQLLCRVRRGGVEKRPRTVRPGKRSACSRQADSSEMEGASERKVRASARCYIALERV